MAKTYRKIAYKVLSNKSYVSQRMSEEMWELYCEYFDVGLLDVRNPQGKAKIFARKLEAIRQGSLSAVMASNTDKFHKPAQTPNKGGKSNSD